MRDLRDKGVGLVVVTEKMSPAEGEQLQHAGVNGFLSLSDGPADFRSAVASVLSGAKWYSKSLPEFKNYAIPRLSNQELAALRLYVTGMKMEAVARKMGVASSTAKEYIDRMRAKYAALGRPAPSKLHLHQNALHDGFLESES